MRINTILAGLAAVLLTGTVYAGGVAIDPGMWEMTSTMTMTMMPTPQTTTVKECIEKGELNPGNFNMDKENPCGITDIAIDGNTASWSINCPTPSGPVMEGQWEMTSGGDTISGAGTMEAEFSGKKMGFNMTWEGKRVGDCE